MIEVWEMTLEQYQLAVMTGSYPKPERPFSIHNGDLAEIRRNGANVEHAKRIVCSQTANCHAAKVTMAVVNNKPVPLEVLTDYPKLKEYAERLSSQVILDNSCKLAAQQTLDLSA